MVAVRITCSVTFMCTPYEIRLPRALLAPILEMDLISLALPSAHLFQPTEYMDVQGVQEMNVGPFLQSLRGNRKLTCWLLLSCHRRTPSSR